MAQSRISKTNLNTSTKRTSVLLGGAYGAFKRFVIDGGWISALPSPPNLTEILKFLCVFVCCVSEEYNSSMHSSHLSCLKRESSGVISPSPTTCLKMSKCVIEEIANNSCYPLPKLGVQTQVIQCSNLLVPKEVCLLYGPSSSVHTRAVLYRADWTSTGTTEVFFLRLTWWSPKILCRAKPASQRSHRGIGITFKIRSKGKSFYKLAEQIRDWDINQNGCYTYKFFS